VLDVTEGTAGGYKSYLVLVGGGLWTIKFESGVQRVPVPATEQMGRVHTSAASVVVMPDRKMAIEINPADLEYQTARSVAREVKMLIRLKLRFSNP
jgi:peptide chain release factor 1